MKLRVKNKITLTPIAWVTLLERAPRFGERKHFEVWQGLRKRVMKQLTPEKSLGDLIGVKIEEAERDLIQSHSMSLFTMLGRSNFEEAPVASNEIVVSETPSSVELSDDEMSGW
jgi:hypothetical protein